MSFTIINGKLVETLDSDSDSDYLSEEVNMRKLFVDNAGNIHFHVGEKEEIHSFLGKRKLRDAFGFNYGDKERYGQDITNDFFATNIGHGVIQKKNKEENIDYEEILNWCYKYLASKNLNK